MSSKMSKRIYKIFLLFMPAYLSAALLSGKITLSPEKLHIEKSKDYVVLNYPSAALWGPKGAPLLPLLPIRYILPSGSKAVNIKIKNVKTIAIGIDGFLYPSQGAVPLSLLNTRKFIPPDSIYYNTHKYEPFLLSLTGTGNLSGYTIANLLLSPVIYYPLQKKIEFVTEIDFEIEYTPHKTFYLSSEKQKKYFGAIVRKLVQNKKDISKFEPYVKNTSDSVVDMVIITPDSFAPAFEPLREWKVKNGIRCEIIPIESIYANYLGRDRQEKIRIFLKDYHDNHGLIFVLLGGQGDWVHNEDFVPTRYAYLPITGFGPTYDSIPCDLYYSDLDGSWDFNKNDVFGEIEDSVDMYPDVIVGRYPIKSLEQIENLVNKEVAYESSPPAGYLNNNVLAGQMLFPYFNYWGYKINDTIAQVTPSPPVNDVKLYESLGTLTTQSFIDAVNRGAGFFHYALHGNPTSTYYFGIDNIREDFNNGNKLGIHTAISCLLGAGDLVRSGTDCYAEELLNKENGGAVADIMNTRFGWGAPPRLGPSELIDLSFYSYVFSDSVHILGMAHTLSLSDWIPVAMRDSTYRYCIYDNTVFGDPSLFMWQDEPGILNVFYPEHIDPQDTLFTVFSSMPETRVILTRQNHIMLDTLISGYAELYIRDTLNSEDTLNITFLKENFIPAMGRIIVKRDGLSIFPRNLWFRDNNNSAVINPGDTVFSGIVVENTGSVVADNVYLKVSTLDSGALLIKDSVYLGSIAPRDIVVIDTAFSFYVNESVPDNHFLDFTLIMANNEDTFKKDIYVQVTRPLLRIDLADIYDTFPGDNHNFILDPGEIATINFDVTNAGHAFADSIFFCLKVDTVNLKAMDSLGFIDTLAPYAHRNVEFLLRADSIVENGTGLVYITAWYGPDTIKDSVNLVLSIDSFFTSVEDSFGKIPIFKGEWHITGRDAYSSPESYWCGNEKTGTYSNNMESCLYLPPFIFTKDAHLSFYYKLRVQYNHDSAYIDVSNDGKNWRSIFKTNLTVRSWLPYTLPIKGAQTGDTVFVRFRLKSDENITVDGWFIDDIKLTGVQLKYYKKLVLDSIWLVEESRPNNAFDRGEDVGIKVNLRKFGLGNIKNLTGYLKCITGGVILRDSVVHYGNFYSLTSSGHDTLRFRIVASDTSKVRKFRLYLNGDSYHDSIDFNIVVGRYVGPDEYGYYAYTDLSPYEYAPEFSWIEIGKSYGYGKRLMEEDNTMDTVYLPFTFKFYGKEYNKVVVSSNGWIGFGDYKNNYPRNGMIPDSSHPNNIIAGLWDYMNPHILNSGKIYYMYLQEKHIAIFEWDSVAHGVEAPNKFEILLYDPDYYHTLTGDGEILIQYLLPPIDKSFTVGIEGPSGKKGLLYCYNEQYVPGAATIESGRAIKFTTNAPFVKLEPIPQAVKFEGPFPNVIHNEMTFKIALPDRMNIEVDMYDVSGRLIKKLVQGVFPPGNHIWHFNVSGVKVIKSGLYFVVFKTDSSEFSRKVIVVK